jgi:hypothetical protein
MPAIYFHLLSIPDAEDAIAETWNILEEYDIPSPGMTVTFRGDSRVNIALHVDDPVDAQILVLRLAQLGSVAGRRHGASQEMLPTRCPHVHLLSVAPSRSLNSSHDHHRWPLTAILLS